MELKFGGGVCCLVGDERSNRTFMELKCFKLGQININVNRVLIVPLWN